MRYKTILLSTLILLLSPASVLAVSPYVSSNPPAGQYHPLSELWINETVINWLGVKFENISSVGAQTGFYLGNPLLYPGNYGISLAFHGSYSDLLLTLDDGSGRVNLYWNAYFNGTYHKYLASDSVGASRILINGNTIQFFTAPSGTAGDIIYWNNPLTIVGMNVGIGTSNPQYLLDVNGDARIVGDLIVNSINGGVPINNYTIGSYALTYITIRNYTEPQFNITPSNNYLNIVPGQGINVTFNSSDNYVSFSVKAGTGLGFDANGNLINTGDIDASDDITNLASTYPIEVSRSGNSATISLLYNTSAGLNIDNNYLYVKVSDPIVYDVNGALTLKTCPDGYILKYDSSNGWICSPDETATTTGGLYSINVQDSSGNTQFIIDNSSNYIRFSAGEGITINFNPSINTVTISDSNANSEIIGSGNVSNLAYFTDTQQISSANTLYYDDINGRLGVNTNSPSATLDVQGTINAGNNNGKILIKDTGDIEILI